MVSTRPVEDAIAFGGVEMGKSIAMDAQAAMNTIIGEGELQEPRFPPGAEDEGVRRRDIPSLLARHFLHHGRHAV